MFDWYNLLGAGSENLVDSVFDMLVKDNVEAKKNSGIAVTIKRTMIGGCCDWCREKAGSYEYLPGKYPEDIFKRHQNCRCLVTHQANGAITNVWTKKEYETERQAIIDRETELKDAAANANKYLRLKEIAREAGEKYIDATEYWLNKPKIYHARVINTPERFTYLGSSYRIDGVHVVLEPDENERRVANLIADRFGGTVQMMPKIYEPENVETPDYYYEGERWDLKTIHGAGKHNLDNKVKDKKEQAEYFIFDVSDSPQNDEELREKAISIMRSPNRSWIKGLMLLRDERILLVLERI